MKDDRAIGPLKSASLSGGFAQRIWGGRTFGWLEAGFLLVILVALVMRLWELGDRTMHYDEAIHLHFAWKLAESDGAFLGWPWVFGTDYIHSPWMHGPFQIELTAIVFKLFGDTEVTARLAYVLFGTALVGVPYFFRDYLGRAGVFLAAVMLALSPSLLYFSRFGRNDIIMAFFATSLLILMWRYMHEGRRSYLYLASAILALMFATKETAYLVVAVFGLISLILAVVDFVPWALGRTKLSEVGHSAGFFLLLATLSLPQWSALSGFFQSALGLTLTNPDPHTGGNVANVDGSVGLVGAPAWAGETLLLPVADVPVAVHTVVVLVGLALLGWLLRKGSATYSRLTCLAGVPLAIAAGILLLLFRPISDVIETRGIPAFDLTLAVLLWVAAVSSLVYYRYSFQRSLLLLFVPAIATALYAVLFTSVLDLEAVVNGILPNGVTVGNGDNGLPVNYVVALGVLTGTIILSAVLGIRWLGARWLVCAAIFYFIWTALYTTFFTHMAGVFSGSWQSMGYWVAQQDVARGNQPWYYYFVGLPVYELLPLVFGIASVVYFIKRGDVLGLALTVWAGVTFVAYTLASEKMPWLLVNITLPLIFLSAKLLGELVESIHWKRLFQSGVVGPMVLIPLALLGGLYFLYETLGNGQDAQHLVVLAGSAVILVIAAYMTRVTSSANGVAAAGLGIAVLLLAFGTWGALRVTYTYDDSNKEIMVYAQGGSDLQETYARLEELVFSPEDNSVVATDPLSVRRAVEADYDIWYPFQWYVRNAEADRQLRFTCFKNDTDDGWNESCNSLEKRPESGDFQPTALVLTADHAGRRGAELLDYEKSDKLHSLLWYPETYRRPGEARQDENWRDEITKDLGFFKDVAASRSSWYNALRYWIFRDLSQDWFTGDYYVFERQEAPGESSPRP